MQHRICILMLAALFLCGSCRKQQQKLHLFAFSEYIPQEVLDGFTKETGIAVDYEMYDTNEAMLSKLTPGSAQYDVIQPSEYAVEHLIHRDMLAPLDFSQIPNAANLDPDLRNLSYDPGQKYSVPYMTGTVGIVYNTTTIHDPIRGFADVFQDKYKGRIVVVDDNREIVSWAFSQLGIPINDMTPENLAKAKPLLKQWLPLIKVFNAEDPKRPLLGGDVDIGVIYSGDAAKLIEQDKRFAYVLPDKMHGWIDNLCVLAASTHKPEAFAFINYILRPDVSKKISDKFPYTNPNAAARKLLTPEQLANPASYPKAIGNLDVFHDIGTEAHDVAAMMTELRG
jgi:spermidine/putrescine transport system substrate-binding protein/spermidine/putrescine transport system permease protein